MISSKFLKVLPFKSILKRKTLIFWEKFRECIEFSTDFPRKIYSHRTTRPQDFFLKMQENMILGGPIEQHIDQNFWGPPPIPLVNIHIFIQDNLSEPSRKYIKACFLQTRIFFEGERETPMSISI